MLIRCRALAFGWAVSREKSLVGFLVPFQLCIGTSADRRRFEIATAAAELQEDDAGDKAQEGGNDGALGSEVSAGEEAGTDGLGLEDAIVHGVAVDRCPIDRGEAEVPGEMNGDGSPEAAGIDIRGPEKQGGMHGYA